ncbi:MAG: DsbA family protein [Thermoleophilaceae bacterium]|nr:DsbA family protein [Thermoleophilaceae bacterium]
MPLGVRYYTDPACSASWAVEPALRKLMVEFGTDLSITYVMGGLARSYEGDLSPMILSWLDASDRSRMPIDPRLWSEAPIGSTYPACMAVKAAAEQGPEAAGRYLRALREGLLCFRRKLDSKEALVEEARAAGLDAQRFRNSLESNAIVEAFGADLEETRSIEGLVLPSVRFEAERGVEWVFGEAPYERWRTAALAAGGVRAGAAAPDPLAAVARFGRTASIEIATVCELPGPRAEAELWRLAAEWRLKPVRVLTGMLWELG